MAEILQTSLELGLLYGLSVLGVFLTFRVLDFPDLTIEGSFVTGAAATALLIKAGVPGLAAIFGGFVAGFVAGSITAFLHTKLRISKILSGILSLGILYTLNLRLMNGPNISLLNQKGIIGFLTPESSPLATILFLFILVLAVKLFLDWFLQTQFGLMLRATGDNETTTTSFGINTNITKYVGLALSNGLVGLSGGLVGQYQGFVDINMSVGLIVLGIAMLMIGEVVISSRKIFWITSAAIIGAVLYEFIVNIALRLGLAGTDLKLVAALIVIIALVAAEKKVFYGKGLSYN